MTATPAARPTARPAAAPERAPDRRTPHVTVVVPTILARGEEVTRCLNSLLGQDYPAFDVLVVDNRAAGAPDAMHLVPADPRLAVLHEPRPGISAARNHGLAHATGELVAFTDDDVVAEPGWLAALAARFTDQPELDVVTGLIEATEPETDAQRWFEDFYGGFGSERTYEPLTYRLERTTSGRRRAVVAELDHRGRALRSFSLFGAGTVGAGANMAFRTTRLRALGGFDLRLGTGTPARGGEDLAAFVRALWAGALIGYEPAAAVAHTHRADAEGLRRQLHGYGIGFTAMLTALVTTDARLLAALLGQIPLAVRVRARELAGRLTRTQTPPPATGAGTEPAGPVDGSEPGEQPVAGPPAHPGYPRSLVWVEALGWVVGPVAFVRSALRRC